MPRNMFTMRLSARSCWCCCWRLPQSMQLLLFILLVNQVFLCHATWATRTATTATTTSTSTASAMATPAPAATLPLVSSSEATLLTSGLFAASSRSVDHNYQDQERNEKPADEMNEKDDDDELMVVGDVSESEASISENEIIPSAKQRARPSSASVKQTKYGNTAAAASGLGGGGQLAPKQRFKILSVRTNCTRDYFELHFDLNHGFRGLLYAKDFPFECRARGTAHTNITLRLPTSGCGVRAEPRAKGMEFSVRVMLQTEQKLRQSSDILRTVRCKVPLNAMGMSVLTPSDTATTDLAASRKAEEVQRKQSYRNGRMRQFDGPNNNSNDAVPNDSQTQTSQQQQDHQQQQQQKEQPTASTSPSTTSSSTSTPRVRIWLELGGPDGSGAVEVGQATTLTVRAIVPGKMGVCVVDCAALDGLGESTQQLLDERGCPIDEQVMPALHTRFKPAEEGWSKHNDDDLVEKTFAATFPAFKFPDRERLHVSCGVQLCKGNCPNVNCHTAEPLILSPDTHLARIEVFNSLAVTAPQIEVDRLRYDRRYNMSVEEYPPYVRAVHSEGTLCLSVSKLAISFCVLGLIFLVAVIVAIFSLIRSRRRAATATVLRPHGPMTANANANRLHRAEVCTSMFSTSSESAQSARFGSKLFIPYYPHTLPYGRVY